MSRAAVAVVLVVALVGGGWDMLRRSVGAVDDGNEALQAGKAEEALEAYRRAAEQVPASPELHYDTGLALLATGAHDDAAASLRQAVSTPDPVLRAKALMALAAVHAAKEEWQEAVDTYKRVLLLDPSLEDARHNYEIAWLRLHPPCSERDDAYEDNDEPKAAKPLDPKVQGPLTACPGDDDWFGVAAEAGSAVLASVRTETEGAALSVTLVDSTGHTVGEAQTAEGVARIDLRSVEAAGAYLLRVADTAGVEAAYTLDLMALPPCPAGDDGLEPNGTPEEAKPVEKGEQALRLCAGDEDWFAATVADGEDLAVSVQYDAPRGHLSLTLLTGDAGEVLGTSAAGAGKEQVVLKKPAPGTYTIRVAAAVPGDENLYQLSVSDKADDKDGDGDKDQQDQQEDKDQQDQQDQQEDKDQQDEKDEKDQQEPKSEQEQQREEEQQRIDDVLRSLQEEDRNLALERALKAAPPRAVEKEW